MHPYELTGPGTQHLGAGYQLLMEHGYPEEPALLALNYEDWNSPYRTLGKL